MKIYVFGSCSGTEPMEGRQHTSLAMEINGRIYWFDAGEGCSRTAHLMGVDLLSVSDIFISHPHMDHVGGLGNLLWNIRKLTSVKKQLPKFGDVTVHLSAKETFDGVLSVLKNSEGNYGNVYQTLFSKVSDGTILENDQIKVQACHNFHLPETENGFRSFSFCVYAEGKKIVYSGDVKGLEDISGFLEGGCDALFMETGHHKAEDICQQLKNAGGLVKHLYFMHHGRGILYDYEGSLERCRAIYPSVTFCNDADVFKL